MQLRKRKFEERPLLSKYISAICKKRRVEKEFFHPSYDLGSSQSINDQFTQLVLKWMKKANKGYAERGKNEGIYFQEDYVREHSDDVFAGFDLSIFGIDISDDSFWHTSDREDQALILNRRLKKGKNRAFSALFQGPTIADCGAVLQMCILRALEEFLGTEGFDKYLDDGRELILSGTPLSYDDNPINELLKPEYCKNVCAGSILWIEGVDTYRKKHLYGTATGWYLVCVGQNDQNEELFLGFDPDNFSEPLTLEQITEKLIYFYNKDQSDLTKSLMDDDSISLQDIKDALKFKDHKATNGTIGGIQHDIRRFDEEKLKELFIKYSAAVSTCLTGTRVTCNHPMVPRK